MLRLRFTARSTRSLARIADFNRPMGEDHALSIVRLIGSAVQVLAQHPYIGRPVGARLRELVISHGKTGYVALYSIDTDRELVQILAIRHQRESGFAP